MSVSCDKRRRKLSVFRFEDKYIAVAYSKNPSGLWVRTDEVSVIPLGVLADELGRQLEDASWLSGTIESDEIPSSSRMPPNISKATGLSSYYDFYRKAVLVGLYWIPGDVVAITPTKRNIKKRNPEYLHKMSIDLPWSGYDRATLGRTVLDAFEQCE